MAYKIGLDPGHGSDTYQRTGGKGVRVGGVVYEEHTSNAKVAQLLKAKLEDEGFDVVYGQEPFAPEVSLTNRTNFYNRANVDLVWSIHFNAGASSASGACAFYWHTADDSKSLAECYADCVREAGYETHGHGTHACVPGTWTNFHICRETAMTAVLTENGFMTNEEDFVRIFQSDKYLEDLAEIHAQAICEHYGVKRGVGVSDPVDKVDPVRKPKPQTPKKAPDSNYEGNSIVEYLNSIDEDSSFDHRVELAEKYGVSNYRGTAAQNLELLNKLRNGEPEPTHSLPNEVYYVKYPMFHGSGVRAVQEALASVYFYPNKGAKNNGVDGWYGNNTADAVGRFQSMHGLKVDQVYGPNTREALLKAM